MMDLRSFSLVGGVSPVGGSVPLAVTDTTGRVELGLGGTAVLLTNVGDVLAHVRLGGATVEAATTDLPLLPQARLLLARGGETHLAAITAAGETTIIATRGYGS